MVQVCFTITMPKNKLNSEQRFIRNILIGFFSALFIVFVFAMIALFQTLTTSQSVSDLPTVTIQNCYDGDTCTTSEGEKIRLACIDTPELRGKKADLIPAKAARDYLNNLVDESKVNIRRITEDRYGRTVAELSKGPMNIQEHLVEKGFARIYERYSSQCEWSMKKYETT
uniref:Nuclease (SNase-like) protein n=2 Tax=Prochlorococcus marinus TaxID=1219 RepID=A0A0D5A2T8_PROMR|nr:nuclease (SNase-like) protein [Prochlorococcus marinus str. P0902-H212]